MSETGFGELFKCSGTAASLSPATKTWMGKKKTHSKPLLPLILSLCISSSLPSLFPPVQKGFVIGGDDEELHFAFEGEDEESEAEVEEEEVGLPEIVVSEVPSRVRRSLVTAM